MSRPELRVSLFVCVQKTLACQYCNTCNDYTIFTFTVIVQVWHAFSMLFYVTQQQTGMGEIAKRRH